ncbi:zinc dependent phospholipase C family protein [Mucilaginibacter auburnensis]|uniref:Zinc dependent phospholipase C n=1 Tax=Mucilaginibacter auburnensis TaxID=1457233 RepID=A0A2H9VPG9_9SPHI|nr:zinc dependent phospholipase C family protein [Mucilaginibacter auburnensis]PJJ80180.1 zinc dependent phospholipase C [Mucilaginibacter auburnensis]
MKKTYLCRQALLMLCCMVVFTPVRAFSILAHEAIIDAAWAGQLKPLLHKKYPLATVADLQGAYAYAYGGSMVADMGYMPGGSKYFTDLLHYVRSGDFVTILIAEADNVNEYAFALGALSHYMADKYGHALATNLSVAIDYPELQKKFGDVVTYHDDHTSHSRIEFAFDVIQTVKGNYANAAYHKFVGFEVATPVLQRAFRKTYGQDLSTVFPNIESSITRFRWGVQDLFPELARVAWQSDKAGVATSRREVAYKGYSNRIPTNKFDNDNTKKLRTGFVAQGIARLIQRLPKIGPLKKMGFKYPGVTCEELFLQSMDSIMVNYDAALAKVSADELMLVNIDYDTGNLTALNEYALADETYNAWVARLQADKNAVITPTVLQNILAFYNKEKMENLAVNNEEEKKQDTQPLFVSSIAH